MKRAFFTPMAVALLVGTASLPAVADERGAIRLRSGEISGPLDTAGLAGAWLATRDAGAGGPILLRFAAPIDDDAARAARAAGIHLTYAGDGAYIARLPAGGVEPASQLPGLDWWAPYHPGLRVAPGTVAYLAARGSSVPLTLHLFPEADAAAVAARLRALGLEVVGVAPGRPASERRAERAGRIVFQIEASRFGALGASIAGWTETLWIERRPVYRLLNDSSVWVGQSGLDGGHDTPVFANGLSGEGQIVGVLDTGIDADMCFFRDDALGLPPTHQGLGQAIPDLDQRKVVMVNFLWAVESAADPTDWDTQDHGTHVAGSVAGDNLVNPGARDSGDGMAPAAKLVIQDGGFGTDNCADLPAIGCPAADLYPFFEQAYQQGARIHSNSWGDRENFTPSNIYSDGSEAADAFTWDHPDFLLFFAAGNGGPGAATVASPATGKNVVAVGATQPGASAGSIASFSSVGPVQDGRIKPDLTAPGANIVSADNDGSVSTSNCGTKFSSGTSMACPTAAGLAALVRQYYADGFYPSGAPSAPDAFVPSAALVKATLIASAAPMTGVASPPPSGVQGWGRILLDDALYFPADARRLFVADVAERFSSAGDPFDAYALSVLDGGLPLRVVLAWTDYPSNPAAAINLVNDLHLEVESPSGTVYRGNVFAGGASVPGGTADTLNNVEAVRVENPEIGTWTVRVHPHAIPQAAQGYALVATGRLPAPGIVLERGALDLDDAVGGNGDGRLDPGEWIDLDVGVVNSGSVVATNVEVNVQSLTGGVLVVQPSATVPDVAPGELERATEPLPRIRLVPDFTCTSPLTLHLSYTADGFARSEDVTLPTGARVTIVADDFEGTTSWQHVAAESNATSGAWIVGDPIATGFQPADDATPGAGTRCLYTAANPGGSDGIDDVDGGVVVARSGAFDLAGHPEARLSLKRWFANRDVGVDTGDYFRLRIRESSASADVLLEELDFTRSAPAWNEVTFRVADFAAPGPDVRLAVSAADGTAIGNIIEAAIDEILFWEPVCQVHDPAPNPVLDLHAQRGPDAVTLDWTRPAPDPAHGEPASYRVYRSATPSGGYALLAEIPDTGSPPTHTDTGTNALPALYYQVIATNPAGAAELLP